MRKSLTDEAIVLRTYNVGETDRFCILLTKEHGKIAVRARGVRKLTSRRAGGLLPMHRISVTLEEHSFGYVVAAATCIDAHSAAWKNPQAFGRAARGMELLLTLTEEGVELSSVYDLAVDFLVSCSQDQNALLVPLFTCKLLSELGFFPSVTHSAFGEKLIQPFPTIFYPEKGAFMSSPRLGTQGIIISESTLTLLRSLDTTSLRSLPTEDSSIAYDLERITQGLLGNQLGASLASPPVCLAISSSVTPICQ